MLNQYKAQIDQHLTALIHTRSSSLYDGARHVLLSPGKRMRPLLTLATTHMLDAHSIQATMDPACALEMVHTYSLIHDDLPCMDDDDFRRGQPTLHRLYTEGHAVLTGDYLLTYAFDVLSNASLLTDSQKIQLIQTLALASGGEGMIGGQILDIEDSDQIEKMHTLKTAALFSAAIEFGAIVANASPQDRQTLKTFGLQFGQLFQMVDDILDNDHPEGLEKAESATHALYNKALQTLKSLPYNSDLLLDLTNQVFTQAVHKSLPSNG
ncbi:MAG: Farnesyl diphosphate synthase [Chlamydiales bacterium]|nr:Farnesyl diphosphate synthase [Chlamydiales bacterium]